jgi:hypothetical protein
MICSSVNLDFLIVRLLILRVGLYSNLDQFAGLRSASAVYRERTGLSVATVGAAVSSRTLANTAANPTLDYGSPIVIIPIEMLPDQAPPVE